MAIDLATLWDFGHPEASERKFRDALQTASAQEALVVQTQIARSYGLRKNFSAAQAVLQSIAGDVPSASAEVRTRYALELGRTYASATHTAEQLDAVSKGRARASFERALEIARASHLDGLAIDAIHMLAFVDPAPAEQLKWSLAALAVLESSSQAEAKVWEASVRNNVGYALHQLGRLDEALEQFKQAVILRERSGNAEATRVARWMVAWTLRAQARYAEALAIQLELERAWDADHEPDPCVFEELELLYRALGDEQRALHYAARHSVCAK